MLIVSCTKCHGWIVVVADERDTSSAFSIAALEEGAKPNRSIAITKDVYDERSFGLTGSCIASYGKKRDCAT